MMLNVTLGNMQVAYQDLGEGTPLVLAHCSSASSNEWAFLNNYLSNDYRILAPDLLGYGKSSAWPQTGELPSTDDADVLDAIIEKGGAPVHLIGHSYGGAVCLEVARRYVQRGDKRAIRSLFLIEPVAFYLLRTSCYEKEWHEISRIGSRCIEACDAGNAQKAARIFMSYWIGHLNWQFASRRLRSEVIRTIHKVAHEFRAMFIFPYQIDAYTEVRCPITLVYGERSRRTAIAVVKLIRQTLGHAAVTGIPGADHMSPFTHKLTITRLLKQHLDG